MSEQTQPTQEQAPEEFVLVGSDPQAQLGSLLNFLAPEEEPEETEADTADADTAGEAAGSDESTGEAAGAADPTAGDAAAGAGSEPAVPGAEAAASVGTVIDAGAGPLPGVGTVDASTLDETWGEITTGFEVRQLDLMQNRSLDEVRSEMGKYFEAIQQHPRTLVGKEVPSLTSGGTETLRDSADAKEWQEAVKYLLVEEVSRRTEDQQASAKPVFEVIHRSIDIFRDNADLVPGTKQFDKQLADEVVSTLKEYEQRVSGKLIGYTIPVQPIINQVRSQLIKNRAAAPTPAAAPTAQQRKAAEQPRNSQGMWEGPTPGITSKAGQSSGSANEAIALVEAFGRSQGYVF